MLLIVYLLETGVVLAVAPWSVFWDRNLVVELAPRLGEAVRQPAVRGAVTGVGLVNLGGGLVELATALGAAARRWRGDRPRYTGLDGITG